MKSLSVIVVVLFVTACAGLPVDRGRGGEAAEADVGEAADRWLGKIGGAGLIALVEEAWRANPGFAAKLAAVERARAQAVISGAARFPEWRLSLDASRSRRTFLPGSFSIGNRFGLATDVSWMPDLWGRLAARQRAGLADLAAAEADARGARLMLAGDVAKAWLRAIEAAGQWRLARQERDNGAATLEVIEGRYRAGLNDALDVYMARESLATADAAEVAARQRFDAAVRVLETLLGRHPGARASLPEALPAFPGPVPAGIDSRVLLRRPDVAAWRQRFVAAEARSADAARNRFPSVSLTVRGGTQSTRLAELLDWDNLIWSLAAGIVQPLFDGGRLRAEQLLARANERETLAGYAQAVLTALREVQTTLAAEPLLAQRVEHQRQAVEMASQAAALALENYRAGLIDIDALLNTQRRAYALRRALLTTRLDRRLNRIDLHLAIGGDASGPGAKEE